jgi:hypothetical protein
MHRDDAPTGIDGGGDGPPPWLFGRWRLLRADAALDFAPGVAMEFGPGGRLRYSFVVEGHSQVVSLIYRVTGDVLQTDNPSASHVTATRFALGEGGVLVLDFSGARAWFVREEDAAR